MDEQMDWHTDDQRETIIPRHYRVVGYKNKMNENSRLSINESIHEQ